MADRITTFRRSHALVGRLHRVVPGGGHTYSKGLDQFPYNSPQLITEAKGAYCVDVDGNRFLDWAMGNRVLILGHGYEPVLEAVKREIDRGVNYTRPGILELEVAEYLLELHSWAEMVKFGKNGSDVTTAAVKLARAYTGRDMVAVCGDHPFFSTHDWFIGSTPMDAGIPLSEKNWTVKFRYNDLGSIEKIFAEHSRRVAAIILEPVKNDAPKEDFLLRLRELATREGTVLIFDEMIAAMRFHIKGAHELYGVRPDLATFGKAVSNGFSFSFLLGTRDIMKLGGLDHKSARVFLLSQTHASESVGLAACRATLDECRRLDTTAHVWSLGKRLVEGVTKLAAEGGMAKHVRIVGFDCNPQILCTHEDGTYWPELHTSFHEEVIANGVLIPWTSITWAHGEQELAITFEAIAAGIAKVRRVIDSKAPVEQSFTGPAIKAVFREFN